MSAVQQGKDNGPQQTQEQAHFFTVPLFSLGHELIGKPQGSIYMNENAVRARAGLLNATAWTVLALILSLDNPSFIVYTIAPVALWDMVTAAAFGLTPLSPFGVLGTILTIHLKPVWKPAEPKRFAWVLGAIMVSSCITLGVTRTRLGVVVIACSCILLTWLEAVLGFCLGCWMWNNYVAKALGKELCEECTMDFADKSNYSQVGTSNDDESDFINKAIANNNVVVFSKSVCPHCKRAKAKLNELQIPFHTIEIDGLPRPAAVANALIGMTGRKTVPNVFVGGKSIGGADETVKMADTGALKQLLAECGATGAVVAKEVGIEMTV